MTEQEIMKLAEVAKKLPTNMDFWAPDESISQAMEVLNAWLNSDADRGVIININKHVVVVDLTYCNKKIYHTSGEVLQEVICQAVLKAVGEEIKAPNNK